ncbi:MAG: hypothetical protein QOD40_1716 [Alphaproteobacteria bacterium]|nr:hypothetical protein [Alphaproteobacteria bacterium]
MPQSRLSSDFLLSAFELATDESAKITFLETLAKAAQKSPMVARRGYTVGLAAASNASAAIRRAAYQALEPILEKSPLRPDKAAMETFARARVYDEGNEDWAHQATAHIDKNPGWADAALPIFIKALDDPKADRNNAYQQFNYIVQQHPELAEQTLPIARAYLADPDVRIRAKALMDVDFIMKKRPELADEALLLQVGRMAATDEDERQREDAGDVLKEFAQKNPRRAQELEPNKRLQQATARLQVIAGRSRRPPRGSDCG